MPIGVVYMLHVCTNKQFSTLQTHSTRIKESIGLQKLYSCIFLHVQCASFLTLFLSHSIICPSICLSLIASGLWWYIKLYLPYWKNLHAVLKYILFMVPGGDFPYYIWHWVSFHILVSPSSGTCAVGCTMLYSSLELVLFSVNNMTFRKSPVITVLPDDSTAAWSAPSIELLGTWLFLTHHSTSASLFQGHSGTSAALCSTQPANLCYFTLRSQSLNCIKTHCVWIPVLVVQLRIS